MSRRGFALLAVLWLLVALAAVGGVSVAAARLGAATTRNRVLLARADWAREACAEILVARYAQHPGVRALDTIDLGRGTWCTARLEDPGAKLNVNVADREVLAALVRAVSRQPSAVSIVDSLIHRRPLADIGELADVPEIDSTMQARLETLLTTRGSGQTNLNAAPAEVLATVPGLTNEGIDLILQRRVIGQRITSADELATSISPSARAVLYGNYQDFLRSATFAPTQLVATVTGGVHSTRLVARATLTMVPLPERLAVVRREVE
jgi:type II secretory pathway component PulK